LQGGDIYRSDSCESIGTGYKTGHPVKTPFAFENALWVSVGSGKAPNSYECFRVYKAENYDGPTHNYPGTPGDEFYHGMKVKFRGEDAVLVGPPIDFIAAKAAAPAGIVADDEAETIPATTTAPKPFQIGDRVKWATRFGWNHGEIEQVRADGSFGVRVEIDGASRVVRYLAHEIMRDDENSPPEYDETDPEIEELHALMPADASQTARIEGARGLLDDALEILSFAASSQATGGELYQLDFLKDRIKRLEAQARQLEKSLKARQANGESA